MDKKTFQALTDMMRRTNPYVMDFGAEAQHQHEDWNKVRAWMDEVAKEIE